MYYYKSVQAYYCHSYYQSFEIFLSDWRRQNYRMHNLVIVIPLQLM